MSKLSEKRIDELLALDCRGENEEESIKQLDSALRDLPFMKGVKSLTTNNLENIIMRLENRFGLHLAYIMRNKLDEGDVLYTGMIKKQEGGLWIETVYGVTVWEVYAKALFIMFLTISKERNAKRKKKKQRLTRSK